MNTNGQADQRATPPMHGGNKKQEYVAGEVGEEVSVRSGIPLSA